jgi:hypothetical protein
MCDVAMTDVLICGDPLSCVACKLYALPEENLSLYEPAGAGALTSS